MKAFLIDQRTEEQQEADARKITCVECHAPVDAGCVGIGWELEDGEWQPYFIEREFHRKRLKWFDKKMAKFGRIH